MFRTLLFIPIFNLVIVLYKLLGQNLGLAIIAIALLSRFATYPVLSKQMKSAKKMKDLQPKLSRLKKKYKDDKQKYNEEQLKLYKEMGVNPVGGCLPMIVQLIFLIQVRNVVVTLVNDGFGAFNEVAYFNFLKFADDAHVNLNFLGMNLSKVAADFSFSDPQIIPYVILALLVGLTQLFSTKVLLPSQPKEDKKKDKKAKNDEPSLESMSGMMNTQMTYLMPVITVFMSLGFSGGSSFFSAALSLFWTVQNLFVIIQKLVISPNARKSLMSKAKGILGRLNLKR